MTHAEYVAQGYPELYGVTDVYEETNGDFVIDVMVRKYGELEHDHGYAFGTVDEAEAKKAELEAEIAGWEVEVNEDDPQADYERAELKALREGLA